MNQTKIEVPPALDVPEPQELVQEVLHSQKKKHRLFRIMMHIIFYLCALAVIIFGGYQSYCWCSGYYKEHEELKNQVAETHRKEKALRDIEKTLLVSYEFLTRYEAHYYAIIFNDYAKAYGLPWEIYAALVRIESNFNPTVKSDKDAKGMTQVLEATGKRMAELMHIPYKDQETLWVDILNISIGFCYFSEGYRTRLNEGATRDEAIKHAIKRYLGGTSYREKMKKDQEKHIYISEYKNTVWQEFKKLQYIYKGICADSSYVLDPVIQPLPGITE